MARYHLSPTIGPAKCSAQNKCAFADDDGNEPEHYPNKAAAENAWSQRLASENPSISTISNEENNTLAVESLEEDALIDLESTFEELGITSPESERSKSEYTRVLRVEKTPSGTTLYTTTQGSLSLPEGYRVPLVEEIDEEDADEIEDDWEVDAYEDLDKQEMFEDAVMDFDGARERYVNYLATLPKGKREKETQKFQDALIKEQQFEEAYF